MTRAEADLDCASRNSEPGRQPGVRWLVREKTPGDWAAVRVVIPGLSGQGPIGTLESTAGSGPRPGQPPDPRPVHNPFWGPG